VREESNEGMKPVIKLAFLDVGQGDTTIISCPDTQEAIVVDCVDSEAVIAYLERERIKHLRGVIITHLHADHYKQTADLLYGCEKVVGTQGCEILATSEAVPKTYPPKRYPPDGDEHSTAADLPLVGKGKRKTPSSLTSLSKLYNWCQKNQTKCQPFLDAPNVANPIQGTLAQSLRIFHPPFSNYATLRASGLNNVSVVIRIGDASGTGASALLTGDLEPEGWAYLKEKYSGLESNILKFPHHGGTWREAETDDLLTTVRPSAVIISVGSNNTFDHPRAEVFTSLKKRRNLRLLCTQATDKCQLLVHKERNSVITAFEGQIAKDRSFFLFPRENQCPCSGTVIIELRDTPQIVQPESVFHESLITAHYRNHQCSLLSVASSTATSGEMTTGHTEG